MQHTFYAVFDNPLAAQRAASELEGLDTSRNHVAVKELREQLATGSGTKPQPTLSYVATIMHSGHVMAGGELVEGESAIRRGVAIGLFAGAVLGALAGALVIGPAAGAGIALTAMLGGMLGAIYGGVTGGLAAASGPDPGLEKLARGLHDDEVLLTVEAPGLTIEEDAESIVQRHGGRIQHRQLV